ncbi:DUF4870 domain-containing protein [Flavobacterium sp. CYK-4]|uniref:DUF4870 domain-containing protein n=1 Tax=Flavobacterium lotistagni TaxID=2709660 RepID=UPI00140C49B7|nr:DUF4870 domain-containing protein [Flavobacterium lotistagni]NHM06312.1 DUF4870 domain-containing protein [Flavobacterium lotistagni]
METTAQNNTAALLNLSTLTQYFIPFGNLIFPIIIWTTNKDKSEYVNQQGKQTINFQLSLFLYSCALVMIAVPTLLVGIFSNTTFSAIVNNDDIVLDNFNFSNISGVITIAVVAIVLFMFMKIAEFILIIYASLKTSNGDDFKYPLTINFIK